MRDAKIEWKRALIEGSELALNVLPLLIVVICTTWAVLGVFHWMISK